MAWERGRGERKEREREREGEREGGEEEGGKEREGGGEGEREGGEKEREREREGGRERIHVCTNTLTSLADCAKRMDVVMGNSRSSVYDILH